MEREKGIDLEDRLVKFAKSIAILAEELPGNFEGKYIAGQITRSGISSALNYGEAKSAESCSDFIHKMKISLKELRETFIALKILKENQSQKVREKAEHCFSECNQLISIFVKSIQTAEQNRKKNRTRSGNR